MPKLGAYSKEIVLAKPDRRTREGRLLKQVRQELTRHVGGNPTPPQRQLIERAAMYQLRVAKLDEKVINGTFTIFDSKVYDSATNKLTRVLTALGIEAASASAKPLALDEYLARLRGGEAAD